MLKTGPEERRNGILLHGRQDWILALCFCKRSGEMICLFLDPANANFFRPEYRYFDETKNQGDATHAAVPTCLFGCLCLMDAVVIYTCLPDTSLSSMPDTISDVEDDVSEGSGKSLAGAEA